MRDELYEAAKVARQSGYAPYSNYQVGAAILTESGKVFTGCNVENAVYPLGQCAERVAVQMMVAAGEHRIAALLLITENGATPCGACRQVISEFAIPETVIYIADEGGIVRETTIADLLPEAFRLQS